MSDFQSPSPINVLVVEDDRTYRQFLMDWLKDAGHTVTPASDGEFALQVLKQQQFDLAFVDLSIPHIDGLQLIGLARDDPRHQKMKIVVLTSSRDPSEYGEALAKGANATCPKPIRRQGLLSIVKAMFGPLQRREVGALA